MLRKNKYMFMSHQHNTGLIYSINVTSKFFENAVEFRYLGATLTLRRLMSYIYMEHPFLMFLDHTQRRSTVGRTPLDE